MQDTHDNPFVGVAVTSPNTRSDMQTAQLNLDIEPQNASLVYLQALKDHILTSDWMQDSTVAHTNLLLRMFMRYAERKKNTHPYGNYV